MNFALPFRWLRSLARALRHWLGSVRAGRAGWECHSGRLAFDVRFRLLVPPPRAMAIPSAPGLTEPDLARMHAALAHPRDRMLAGEPFRDLISAVRQGAHIVARLEEASPEKRPAVLRIGTGRDWDC